MRRAIFGSVTCGEVMWMPGMPPCTIASASPKVAQQMPSAPASTWRRAMRYRFVRLGMRTKRHADGARMRRHRRDVAVERVAIDEQRRRVEPRAAAGHADQSGVGSELHQPLS